MSTTNTEIDVFHSGELAVQERAGSLAQGRNSGRMVADAIIPGAIKFVKKQPMVVIGSVDAQQNLWASIIVGATGFMTAEPRAVDIDLDQALYLDADPVWRNLSDDPGIGILVIDLRSRARLRVNGRVEFPTSRQLHVNVEEAYPNCPKYIQRRIYRLSADHQLGPKSNDGTELSHHHQHWIRSADTMFVASQHPDRGVDVSHRGGNPGFIKIINSRRLRVPDYAGNGMFNTLGNFATNPRAGLMIPDFEAGHTLQLTGRAEVLWNVEDREDATGGTRRFWDFEIERFVQIENSLPGSAEFLDFSPYNPPIKPT